MNSKIIDREFLVRNLKDYKDKTLYMDKEVKIVDSPETFVICDSTDPDAVLVDDTNLSYVQSYDNTINLGDYVRYIDEVSHTETKRVEKIANTLNAYFVRGRHDLRIELTNDDGDIISEQTVSIPLESVIIGALYDEETNTVIFELQGGDTLEIPTSGMISGLVPDTRTIAGIDLTDDIEAADLRTALDLDIESIGDDDIKSLFTTVPTDPSVP